MDNYRKGHAKKFKSKNFDFVIWDCDYEYLDEDFIKVTGTYETYGSGGAIIKATFIFPIKSIEFIVLEIETLKKK